MQKRTKTAIRICALIVALGIGSACVFWFCRRDRIDRLFDGSRVGNPDGYWLNFSYMDKSDCQTMSVHASKASGRLEFERKGYEEQKGENNSYGRKAIL